MEKYIFVTGGVLSSLGKGIIASSIGNLIKTCGYSISILKIDPYLNIDPGTMNPKEHGEVFVTDDGCETDLDIGNYERFLNVSLNKSNNFTAGQVYNSVLQNERRGKYLGKTVQVVPHITDEIKDRIKVARGSNDFLIIELGGTVGDIEGLPFLEAIRKMRYELGESNCFFVHATLLPLLSTTDELKTKPTQHSIQELRKLGINPDMLVVRSSKSIKDVKHKIVFTSGINEESIIECLDEKSIYSVPLTFNDQNILKPIFHKLSLEYDKPDTKEWGLLVSNILFSQNMVNIAIVGKYVDMSDSYKSLNEALIHSGANINSKVVIKWINSETVNEDNTKETFKDVDGIIVPGGFGERGVSGMIETIKYARENDVPFLGICLGMQLSVIEYARNVLNLEDTNSTEFNPNCKNKIITLIETFKDREGNTQVRTADSNLGGTMRLGLYGCELYEGKLYNQYKQKTIYERHRHRYEFNPEFEDIIQQDGNFVIAAKSLYESLVDVIELKNSRYFVGVQFHPELLSRLDSPNQTIQSFVSSAFEYRKN